MRGWEATYFPLPPQVGCGFGTAGTGVGSAIAAAFDGLKLMMSPGLSAHLAHSAPQASCSGSPVCATESGEALSPKSPSLSLASVF